MPEHLEDTAGYLVEHSPREIPGVAPTTESEQWREQELFDDPEESYIIGAPEVGSQTLTILEKVGIWGWRFLPRLSLATLSGWAGWEIGSEIYGLEFEEPEGEPGPSSYLADHWVVTAPWEWMLSDLGGDIYPPDGRWGLQGVNEAIGFGWIAEGGGTRCVSTLYGDGTRIYSPGTFALPECGPQEYRHYVLWRPLEIVRCGESGENCPGIEPQSHEGAGQPKIPSAEVLKERVKAELESEAYPLLNGFLNWLIQPENYPNPRYTDTEEDHRCDRTPPTYENPGGNASPEPFAKKIETPFTITSRPEGFGGTNIYLHWGTTDWEPAREGYEKEIFLDLWGGWGYRHIVAKHGWSATDLEETQLALVDDLTPTKTGENYRYETSEIPTGEGGVGCNRVVVVDFVAGEGDPRPRGIVTSYNEVE